MFQLQKDDFPVDTHVSIMLYNSILLLGIYLIIFQWPIQVFEISKAIGWVPAGSDRNKTYIHLNQRIPDDLKFDLNCLLYTHGKLCRNCIKKGANQQKKQSEDDSCPLLKYCENSNMN